MTFSRSDESEADLVGMELAGAPAYKPGGRVTLWQKMGAGPGRAPHGCPPTGRADAHPAYQANCPRSRALCARGSRASVQIAPPLKSREG